MTTWTEFTEAAPDAAALMAAEIGWDAAEVERQVDAYRTLAAHEVGAMTGVPAP